MCITAYAPGLRYAAALRIAKERPRWFPSQGSTGGAEPVRHSHSVLGRVVLSPGLPGSIRSCHRSHTHGISRLPEIERDKLRSKKFGFNYEIWLIFICMARVLITGIAGFIGSHLADHLLLEGAEILGVDDLSTGSMRNIEHLRPSIEFVAADVADHSDIQALFKHVDYVYHQAGLSSVHESITDPLNTNKVNLYGTLSVLEAARKANVKRVIYASSAAIYGNTPDSPISEACPPSPRSAYAVQKLAGEYYLSSYAAMYGLETVSLRYFNVFGPRQNASSQYSGVLAKWITQAKAGVVPTIFGDGKTVRDFTHVDNIVRANILAARSRIAVAGQIFNVATGKGTSLLEAYSVLKDLMGFTTAVRFDVEARGDIQHSVGDISLACRLLGYEVVTDFRIGLERTIDMYR